MDVSAPVLQLSRTKLLVSVARHRQWFYSVDQRLCNVQVSNLSVQSTDNGQDTIEIVEDKRYTVYARP